MPFTLQLSVPSTFVQQYCLVIILSAVVEIDSFTVRLVLRARFTVAHAVDGGSYIYKYIRQKELVPSARASKSATESFICRPFSSFLPIRVLLSHSLLPPGESISQQHQQQRQE